MSGRDVTVRRAMVDDQGAPLLQPSVGQIGGPQILAAAGVADVASFRAACRQLVEAALGRADPAGPVAFGLRKRLAQWGRDDQPGQPQPLFWGPVPALAAVRYVYALNGPATVDDAAVASGTIDQQAPWNVDLWIGCFDADALGVFVSGTLSMPTT